MFGKFVKNMFLHESSPLKNLPDILEGREALFFDGLAHAVDIFGIAFPRLRSTLDEISSSGLAEPEPTALVYLDAWSCIDSMDRVRSLIMGYKASGLLRKDDPALNFFLDAMNPVRKMRNVTDHVAQRLDELVSRNASVMGEICWISSSVDGKVKTWRITPGVLNGAIRFNFLLPPAGTSIDFPIGFIHLSAGATKVNLSAAAKALHEVVLHIEGELRKKYRDLGEKYKPIPRHLVASAQLNIRLHGFSN